MSGASHQAIMAAGAGNPPPVTWSFVTQFNANASTISGGTGIQAGDVAILFDAASQTGSSPTNVVPSGWTQITSQIDAPGSTEFRNTISYKVLTAGDITAGAMNSITGMNAVTSNRKIVGVFRPSSAISSITVSGLQEQDAAGSAPTTQTIPTGSATLPAIAIGHFRGGATIPSVTATGATVTQGSSDAHYWAYRIFNSSFADQNISMGDAGNFNLMQSFYLTAG